jgi:hypothetical protein
MVDGIIHHLGHAVLPDVSIVRGKPIQQWRHGCAPHLILFQFGLNGETEPNFIAIYEFNGFPHLGQLYRTIAYLWRLDLRSQETEDFGPMHAVLR